MVISQVVRQFVLSRSVIPYLVMLLELFCSRICMGLSVAMFDSIFFYTKYHFSSFFIKCCLVVFDPSLQFTCVPGRITSRRKSLSIC